MKKEELLARVSWQDPFDGFTPLSAPESWTWNYDREFLQGIYRRIPQPQLIVEVGSWLGNSAIEASKFYATKLNWRDFTLICVDTWLGSAEHWTRPDPGRSLARVHGFPVLYEPFLSNIVYAGLEDLILPLPQTSVNAARILHHFQLQYQFSFDWVYLDASHETMDVETDLKMYWPLVRSGGVLFGDDWNWNSVRTPVIDFCDVNGLRPETSYHSWAIWKS